MRSISISSRFSSFLYHQELSISYMKTRFALKIKTEKLEKSISAEVECCIFFVYISYSFICIFASLAVKTSVSKANQTTRRQLGS